MKKFAVIAVLAVLAAGGLSHKAMAWCKFNFTSGCNICFERGGDKHLCFSYSKSDGGCPSGHCGGGAVYGYPSDLYPHAHAAPAPATTTPAESTFPPKPKPADAPKNGNQPVGYWGTGYPAVPASPSTGYQFYPQGSYGYNAVPSYWYGR